MGGRDFTDPGFDLVLRDLRCGTAIAAHEMMMVFGRLAVAEQGLALGGAKDIDCALIGEGLQIAVHGRKICCAERKSFTRDSSANTA